MNKMVECPYCEGYGDVIDATDDMFGNTKVFYTTCDCCEGNGEIPESEYELAKKVYPKSNRESMKKFL